MIIPLHKAALAGLGVIVLFIASTVIHPFGPVWRQGPARPLLAGASIDDKTLHTISRSCQNCHSEETKWPWYNYVAPVSWLVESDVSRARKLLNLSQWDEYSTEQQLAFLTEISTMVSTRSMPPPRYLLMHRDAKLLDADVEEIVNWVQAETNRLSLMLQPVPARTSE